MVVHVRAEEIAFHLDSSLERCTQFKGQPGGNIAQFESLVGYGILLMCFGVQECGPTACHFLVFPQKKTYHKNASFEIFMYIDLSVLSFI